MNQVQKSVTLLVPPQDLVAGGFAYVAEVMEVRNFARRSDLGSLVSQHHNLIDYLPPLGHCILHI